MKAMTPQEAGYLLDQAVSWTANIKLCAAGPRGRGRHTVSNFIGAVSVEKTRK